MAKSKKFALAYRITLSGRSAEQVDGSTFMGGLLENAVKTFVEAVKLQWPKVEVKLEENKEVCICAAIKTKSGKVFNGHRHSDAIKAAVEAGWTLQDLSFADQGFRTSLNRYVTREEGRKLQDAAGIPSADKEHPGYKGNTLFSEDLY